MMRQIGSALELKGRNDIDCCPAGWGYAAGEPLVERGFLPQGVAEDLRVEFQRNEMILNQVTAGYEGGEC